MRHRLSPLARLGELVTGLELELVVAVAGTPRPQGSKRIGRAGRGPGARPILLDDSPGLKAWRGEVVLELERALVDVPSELDPMFEGPVRVELLFVHDRPKADRSGARWREARPDVDKLARGALDALTMAGVIGDDSQVAELVARKVLALPAESAGLVLTVSYLSHEEAPPSSPELEELHPSHTAGTAGTRRSRSPE